MGLPLSLIVANTILPTFFNQPDLWLFTIQPTIFPLILEGIVIPNRNPIRPPMIKIVCFNPFIVCANVSDDAYSTVGKELMYSVAGKKCSFSTLPYKTVSVIARAVVDFSLVESPGKNVGYTDVGGDCPIFYMSL